MKHALHSPFRNLFLAVVLLTGWQVSGQTLEFSDDFESGSAAWTLTGSYGLSTVFSYSGSSSLTESPVGNYGDAITAIATMASGVDLSSVLDATLSFWTIYSIEEGFDYTYVEVSGDGGPWVLLEAIDGEGLLSPWTQRTYSLGAFAGDSDVKVRFRFVSDGAVNYDGMYIDDLEITSSSTDLSAPLILYDGPQLYEGNLGDFLVNATIIDPSGVASAELSYSVDGGSSMTVAGTPAGGDIWNFSVPEQDPGAWVSFTLTATDAAPSTNTGTTAPYAYIAGNYIAYDNAEIDFVNSFGPSGLSGATGTAVRISLAGVSDLVTVLIRNYTDPTRPNDDMEVHVWADAFGFPGADLLTPLLVTPEATLSDPNRMTRIDLRPFASALSGLSGDIWIGFTVPVGSTWVSQTTPGIAGRTATYSGSTWTLIGDDYHFRAITTAPLGAPEASFSVDAASDPSFAFTDLSSNSPSTWSWNFGDGASSSDQNPLHTFAANGTYNVCLTAGNGTGSDTECEMVTVTGYAILPIADFDFAVDTNRVSFTDASSNVPESWSWDFDDGSTSTEQNPMHTFSGLGVYQVCLIAGNAAGNSSPYCRNVIISELPSGLETTLLKGAQLYPVPADADVFLKWDAPLERELQWELIGIDGKRNLNGTLSAGSVQLYFPTLSLDNGMYWLSLRHASGRQTLPLEILHRN